jgi:hypothetical protein
MSIKRTTRRFKHINEALEHLSFIEKTTRRVDYLKELIGETLCTLCGRNAPLDTFCFGCLDFICNTCQPPEPEFIVAGPHTLDDHREVAAQVGVAASPSTEKP